MSTDREIITPEELGAFLDNELAPDRRQVVGAAIARTPPLAAQLALLRNDKARLAEYYTSLIDQPLPDRLVRAVIAGAPRPTRRSSLGKRPVWGMAIAACLLLAVALGFRLQGAGAADPLVAAAMAARQENPPPGAALPGAALAASVGPGVKIPDLSKAGFRLATTRLVAPNAVELRYTDARGLLFTVFLRHTGGADRFALRKRGTLRVCIWQNDELAAVMVGEMSSSAMLRVASLTYADLNF